MKIKRTSKELTKLAKMLAADKEEIAISLYQKYIGMPESQNEDTGLFVDYLEENELYEISEQLIIEYLNRYPLSIDEVAEVACLVELIEMI